MRGTPKSRLWFAVGITATLVLGSAGATPRSAAKRRTTVHLGPVTVLEGQQAMVSVTNLSTTNQQASVRIYDHDGDILGQEQLTIGPGASGFFDIFAELPPDQVRARVSASGGWLKNSPVALHILEGAEGPTVLILNARELALDDYFRAGPMMHVVPEHGVRVLVTNLSNATATFPVEVINASGDVVGSMTIPNVPPGGTESATVLEVEVNAEHARATVTGPQGSKFLATVELFDKSTGEALIWADWIDQ